MTLASDLIRRSYILAQILDPREEVEGYQSSEGLTSLNDILNQWSSLSIYIPSYTIIPIITVIATSNYTITPAIVRINEANILDSNNAQTDLGIIDLEEFNNINMSLSSTNLSRPSKIFLQNDFSNWSTQSKLIVYPSPDQVYTITLYAMQRLVNVTYSQTLASIPGYYERALHYELAKELSIIYGTVLPQSFFEEYEKLMKELKATNRKDNTVKCSNLFKTSRFYYPWGTYVG
jgi:hypothetical protein